MNRLKDLREDRDLSQAQVAKAIGVSQRVYSNLETGFSALREDILIALANFYDTSVDYLLYRTDERKPLPKSKVDTSSEII